MKIGWYLIVYSMLGYLFERLVNLVHFGFWLDNRVLVGPYQPMYAVGILLTLGLYTLIKPMPLKRSIKLFFLCGVAIVFTGFSEWVSGTLYEHFYGSRLWNYQTYFDYCYHPYVCIIPTTLFGLLALFTVYVVHPFVKQFSVLVPNYIKGVVILIFIVDIIYTYYEVLG